MITEPDVIPREVEEFLTLERSTEWINTTWTICDEMFKKNSCSMIEVISRLVDSWNYFSQSMYIATNDSKP